MSTQYTRQTDWLPGNQAGDSLCTYGAEKQDICHVYLNPDKEDMARLIATIHLMESGRDIDDESTFVFSQVQFQYGLKSNASNQNSIEA